jgi:hypothetical protein
MLRKSVRRKQKQYAEVDDLITEIWQDKWSTGGRGFTC